MYGDWSINKTLEEFVWARENEDTNPYAVFEGGYVLPEVTVNGKKHSIGGPLVDYALNEYSNGGGIHIKPENHGKFTALKERTGHSATWFKEHGTPAQKKMAVFALNSKKWKHDDGGNLFDGES